MLNRTILWMLLISNGLGTIYGFEWYGNQIIYTIQEEVVWLVWFVPDSPTASLFFTIAIAFLLRDQYVGHQPGLIRKSNSGIIRGIVEAMAVITSIKYGIWAVAMIAADAYQGNQLNWQHWMLIASHLAMAVEALLFVRFFKFRTIHIAIVAIWTLSNDFIDYHFGVFPYLSRELQAFLPNIRRFTIFLSVMSILCAYISLKIRDKRSL